MYYIHTYKYVYIYIYTIYYVNVVVLRDFF